MLAPHKTMATRSPLAGPVDFPPWSTVYKFFAAWETDGITQLLVDMLRERVRLAESPHRHPDRGDHRLPVGQGQRERVAVQPRLRRR